MLIIIKHRLLLREALVAVAARNSQVLAELQGLAGVEEAMVLSTCNRLEMVIYGHCSPEAIIDYLAARQEIPSQYCTASAFVHEGPLAARHLFRVAASLESMVIGEYQIQHQVKAAYEEAAGGGRWPAFAPLCQAALQCGKRVRAETSLGKHRLSVASWQSIWSGRCITV